MLSRSGQRLGNPVLPGSSERIDLAFEILEWNEWYRTVDPDREVNPCVAGLPERELIVDGDAVVSLEEQVLQVPSQVRVKPIARDNNKD